MFQNIINWLKAFYHNHICNDFEKVVPHAHPECFSCNAGSCKGCSVNKYPDSLGDLDEEEKNVNFSSGQDDVALVGVGYQMVQSEGRRQLDADDAFLENHISEPPTLPREYSLDVYNALVDCINHLDGVDGKVSLILVRTTLSNITKMFRR